MGQGRKEKEDYFESVTLRVGDRAGRWAVASLSIQAGAPTPLQIGRRDVGQKMTSAPEHPHQSPTRLFFRGIRGEIRLSTFFASWSLDPPVEAVGHVLPGGRKSGCTARPNIPAGSCCVFTLSLCVHTEIRFLSCKGLQSQRKWLCKI